MCDHQVPGSSGATGWKCLGMYALPGEPVTVTVPQALADADGAHLLVGGWSDTLYHLEEWPRIPKVQRKFAVTDVDTVIGSALGGLIYITLPEDWPAVTVTVSGEGCLEGTWCSAVAGQQLCRTACVHVGVLGICMPTTGTYTRVLNTQHQLH
jgi:N-terminal domain of M60-like peptidases